ncbi:uncharacterized protein E0L32_000271 [Thyridium curvatum]|uniref:Chitobiosyldiphosphodolichol beta-mannosyltransferase n=1 Tax=Thyridium curvatum TaxID=1093900 RepID=A0A507B801_9PEZI|nr:uncharacterized protein E0L32_000271 [Thyridium curvatum]TPX15937.1 hypothetical protein E0L32_000271 [Thyridium curvatum]
MERSHIITAAVLVWVLDLVVLLLFWPKRYTKTAKSKVSAQVLVLGDIGRSPRMQYHALSIAKHGGSVELIGYNESPPLAELVQHTNVRIWGLSAPPKLLQSKAVPFILTAPFKVLWQIYDLWMVLCYKTPPCEFLIVQNPPSIPTLAIAFLVSLVRNHRVVIDWHNYGWTILAGTRGPSHLFVRISKLYECLFAKAGNENIAVTNAMARQLQKPPYGIKNRVVAMHDRPATIFSPMSNSSERLKFLSRLLENEAMASTIVDGKARLIVSSTSWTPDEDFGLLLDALTKYAGQTETSQAKEAETTPLLAIITGKGPQKAMYEDKIAQLTQKGLLPGIRIQTMFLPFEDYATLLASADLGVCLHKSSSGVDLPMKVVDMFGAGLPVAAYSGYESFSELVKEGENGCGFETPDELSATLSRLLQPSGAKELSVLKNGAVKEGSRRWDEEWDAVVAPILGISA